MPPNVSTRLSRHETNKYHLQEETHVLGSLPDDLLLLPGLYDLDGLERRVLPRSLVHRFNQLISDSELLYEFDDGSRAVLALTPSIAVKVGDDLDFDCLEVLTYLYPHHPELPIPRHYCALLSGKRKYILQDRVVGTPLDQIWWELDVRRKTMIKDQLTSVFAKLRSVPHPPDTDGQITWGSGKTRRCKDARLYQRVAATAVSGPEQFIDFLLPRPRHDTEAERRALIGSALRSCISEHAVLTHADLQPRNIIVALDKDTGDVTITGIVDWELSGWYPTCWEYVKAISNTSLNPGLQDWWRYLPASIGEFGPAYAVDLMVERLYR
ncbi:hypothetical protein K461DRAFT_31697 [Myriangium duriaei CBS 260.36]|uniref:Aminoglycoside phosphotransferase domain-containing protein n=1 Tax=Myriangium duriaei CBS 260.36 TaxID=1168546 RepID=A0A9P4MQD2_9PEZI|nr:hypothetical protein K461DRAFT_31697 [Myriangium duriaei CBS 260.36]